MLYRLSILLALCCLPIAAFSADEAAKPTAHETRQIEGWTLQVDKRLLEESNKELGQRALRMLENSLYEIALITPTNQLAKLRAVPIWLDLTHGKLGNMQYHPSSGWLRENGYSTNLAKCVHIPSAEGFTALRHHRIQPWCVLHELAHAYHDRVLGFEEPRIKTAWEKWRQKSEYETSLYIEGHPRRHYGLTNHKEFFAEMTESYFGMNDFFPFNRGELKTHEPEVFKLMEDIWGKLP
ncbi:MAG TPA: metallopeptidase [Verrucomicrobiae bacterium]